MDTTVRQKTTPSTKISCSCICLYFSLTLFLFEVSFINPIFSYPWSIQIYSLIKPSSSGSKVIGALFDISGLCRIGVGGSHFLRSGLKSLEKYAYSLLVASIIYNMQNIAISSNITVLFKTDEFRMVRTYIYHLLCVPDCCQTVARLFNNEGHQRCCQALITLLISS